MEQLTASELVTRISNGRKPKLDTTIYDGLTFGCACGQFHSFDTNLTPPEVELPGMRLVIKCPESNHLTCIRIRGFLRRRLESLFGALVPNPNDSFSLGESLPTIGGRGIPPSSGFVPVFDDEVRSSHTGLPHRVASGAFTGSSAKLCWFTVVFGLFQSTPGGAIAILPKMSFIRHDRASAETTHRRVVEVLAKEDPASWADQLPDIYPNSGSDDATRQALVELGSRLRA